VPGEVLNSTAGVEGARLMRVAAAEVVAEFEVKFVAELVAEFVAEFVGAFVVRPRSHALPIPTPRSSNPIPPTAALLADNPQHSSIVL
jgi:hypothetical protein